MKSDVDPKEHFKYGLMVVEAATILQDCQAASVGFVDKEVIPPFDGSPEGIALWFICETDQEACTFKENLLNEMITILKILVAELGFPREAVETLWFDVTSLEAIDMAGGRFAYLR